jgi:rhodanese-related sulfurtransferase
MPCACTGVTTGSSSTFATQPSSPQRARSRRKRFVFYCGTGGRSALAAQRAIEMGLGEVISMAGGFNAWKAADGPVEQGS